MCWTTCYHFHHQDYLGFSFDHVIEFDDKWMVDSFHNFDFTSNAFLSLQVLDLFLLINLQSHFLLSVLLDTHINKSIGALTNLLSNNIIIHGMVVWKDNFFLRCSSRCNNFSFIGISSCCFNLIFVFIIFFLSFILISFLNNSFIFNNFLHFNCSLRSLRLRICMVFFSLSNRLLSIFRNQFSCNSGSWWILSMLVLRWCHCTAGKCCGKRVSTGKKHLLVRWIG